MSKISELQRSIVEKELASAWPQWHITRTLGHGAFGDVYEIRRDEFGVPHYCALKTLRMDESVVRLMKKGHYDDKSASEAFLRSASTEINIMEALKGAPNIVIIEDYALLQDGEELSILIRMELLNSLHGEGKIFSETDVIKIGTDICNALEFCHRKNIIHRDIKESNIFYSKHGEYKLGDFGVSRHIETLQTQAGLTGVGTISYMAPEVYLGRRYDHTADIYSLGIVLYTLLNHDRPPFSPSYPQPISASEAQQANMTRICSTTRPPLPDQAPNALGQIICKACDPTPSNRYQSAYEFKSALLAYQNQFQQGHVRTKASAGGKKEGYFSAFKKKPKVSGTPGQVRAEKPDRFRQQRNDFGGSGRQLAAAVTKKQKSTAKQRTGRKGRILIVCVAIVLVTAAAGTGIYITQLNHKKKLYDRYITSAERETEFQDKIEYYKSAMALNPGKPEAYMEMMEDIEELDDISPEDINAIISCVQGVGADPKQQKSNVAFLKEKNTETYADFYFRLGMMLCFAGSDSDRSFARKCLQSAVDSGGLEDRTLELATQIQELLEEFMTMKSKSEYTGYTIEVIYKKYWEKLNELTKELDSMEELTGSVRYPIWLCDDLAHEIIIRVVEYKNEGVTESEMREALDRAESYLELTEQTSPSFQNVIKITRSYLYVANDSINDCFHATAIDKQGQ